jgi:ADP-ribose pyrophosphatase YjhB (NUDIX family)
VNYCSNCGSSALEFRVPDGDTLSRCVCAQCGTIHYQNPKIVVGCLPEWQGRILLCKRAIEPRLGLWTLPAGFLENGETLAAGALRETLEEADARVAIDSLYTVISLPHINQVYVMFRSKLADLAFGPGSESLEVALFDEEDVPWDQLAFRTIGRTLRCYFLDRKLGSFPVHVSTIDRRVTVKPDITGAA